MKGRTVFFWGALGIACGHSALDRRLVNGDHKSGVSTEDVPVKGATVHVDVQSERTTYPAELVAVDAKYLYVNTGSDWRKDTRAVPRAKIRRVVVDVYTSEAGGIVAWTAVGCASTASHGYYLVFTGPMWLGAGIASAASEDSAARASANATQLDQLYQYARFPQGMPKARPSTTASAPTPATAATSTAPTQTPAPMPTPSSATSAPPTTAPPPALPPDG